MFCRKKKAKSAPRQPLLTRQLKIDVLYALVLTDKWEFELRITNYELRVTNYEVKSSAGIRPPVWNYLMYNGEP